MKNLEFKAGILTGLATIALFGLFHQIEPRWMLHPGFYWGSLMVYLLGMLGACLLEKRYNQGILPFRKALRTTFVTFLVANLLYYGFYYALFNWIDPDLPALQKTMYREFYEQTMEGMELQKNLEKIEALDFSVTWKTLLYGFGQGAIGGFILSLILALSVRQEA